MDSFWFGSSAAPAFCNRAEDLTPNQLNFRLHPAGNSIGEILYHTAGVEHYYGHRMNGTDPHKSEWEARLDNSVMDQGLDPGDFPYEEADVTVEKIKKAFAHGESIVKPILESPTEAQLNSRIQSALGQRLMVSAPSNGSPSILSITVDRSGRCGSTQASRKLNTKKRRRSKNVGALIVTFSSVFSAIVAASVATCWEI